MFSVSYKHGSSSIGRALFHFGFIPKYRHKIFANEEIKKRCEALFRETSERFAMKIHEIGFDVDAVHMLVDIGHKLSPAGAARLFKGISARLLMKEFSWLRAQCFWGGHLWGPQYFYDSVGVRTYETIQNYVRNHPHH